MNVFVLEENWDIDQPESDVVGVFKTLDSAKSKMEDEYENDMKNFGWNTNENSEDADFEVERSERSIIVYSINDYPRIEYNIYEKEVQE